MKKEETKPIVKKDDPFAKLMMKKPETAEQKQLSKMNRNSAPVA